MATDKRTAIIFFPHQATAVAAGYPDLIFLRVVSTSDIQEPPIGRRLEVQMTCQFKAKQAGAVHLVPAIILELRDEPVGEVYGDLYGQEEVLLATAKRWEAIKSREKAKASMNEPSIQSTNKPVRPLELKTIAAPRPPPAVSAEGSALDQGITRAEKEPAVQQTSSGDKQTVNGTPSLRGILLPPRSRLSPESESLSTDDEEEDTEFVSSLEDDRNVSAEWQGDPDWSPLAGPASNRKSAKRGPLSRGQSLSRAGTPVAKKRKMPEAVPSRAKSLAPSNDDTSPNSPLSGSAGHSVRWTPDPSSSTAKMMKVTEKTNCYYREPVPAHISRGGGRSSVSRDLLLEKMVANFGKYAKGRIGHAWSSSLRFAVSNMFTKQDLLTYKGNPFGRASSRDTSDGAVQHFTRLRQIFALLGKTCEKRQYPKPSHPELMQVMYGVTQGLCK